MKKHTVFIAILIISIVHNTNANILSGTCGNNLTWNLTDGKLSIEGSGDMFDYEYNGSPWFSVKDDIKNISISNGVTNIGNNAFYGCSMLTSATIPNGVTSIGYGAFYECSRLASITIPNTVKIIKSEAFNSCKGLTSLIIPDNVTNIGSYAFYCCSNITLLIIPDGVANVGDGAFVDVPNIIYKGTLEGSPWGARCLNGVVDGWLVFTDQYKTNLKVCAPAAAGEIIIPNSVTNIEEGAFLYCTNLTSITISNKVTKIGIRAFGGCSNLIAISFPFCVVSIGDYAFALCSKLASITLPNSVVGIGNYAFRNCYNLVSITLGESLTNVGNLIFENCKKLTSIYVPCGQLERFKVMFSNDNRIKYLPSFNINLVANNGKVTSSSHQTKCDSIVILTPSPNTGYHFEKWSDGNTENPRTIVLTQDTTFTALFVINQYAISVSCNPQYGSIEGENGTFNYGTELTYKVNTKEGYHFEKWSDGNTENPRTIVLTQDSILSAEITINTYLVQFFGFNGVLLDSKTVEHGTAVIAPEAPIISNFTFVGWDKEFTKVTSNLDVHAIYMENTEDIENVRSGIFMHKIFVNGHIFILRNGKTYTVQGQEVR